MLKDVENFKLTQNTDLDKFLSLRDFSEIRGPSALYCVVFQRDIYHHGDSAIYWRKFHMDCTDFYGLLN
jgi:hypothetical protein